MASWMWSKASEVEALRPLMKEFYVIGDGNKAQKIMNGARDAFDAVAALSNMYAFGAPFRIHIQRTTMHHLPQRWCIVSNNGTNHKT